MVKIKREVNTIAIFMVFFFSFFPVDFCGTVQPLDGGHILRLGVFRAHRKRLRCRDGVAELRHRVQTLQDEATTLSTQLTLLQVCAHFISVELCSLLHMVHVC